MFYRAGKRARLHTSHFNELPHRSCPGCELRFSGATRRAGKRAQLRAGYAGHLTIIANQLAAAAARRPAVHAALKAHAAWQSYVVHELGPRNEARPTVPAVRPGCGAWKHVHALR